MAESSLKDDSPLSKIASSVSRGVSSSLEWMLVTMFQLTLGLTARQLLSRAYFLPSILLNSLKLQISKKFKWYNRIDDTIVLGALPFRSQAEEVFTYMLIH